MRKYISYLPVIFLMLLATQVTAQSNKYSYHINLNDVVDDQLKVELKTPEVEQKTIRFYMPNIIPGTYRESNYGMFVSNLKAYNKRGKELPVKRLGKNTWEISKAHKMRSLSYFVEDTYDTEKEHKVYGMSGTNIKPGENFVIYSSGFFGYFEGMKEQPFEVSITKPEEFYGSTGMIPQSSSATQDVYRAQDYDFLLDSPMMYNKPDTTVINVANAKVLVSVYSPNGKVTSDFLAQQFKPLLQAHKDYLGGELPVDKYAFIMFFAPPNEIKSVTGAHEHSYSSFYYVHEMPQEKIAPQLTDIASHEFYHIVTPLNIHSEEIAYFNYNEPDLSKHLWLYEGVTEYASHHIQVAEGLISEEEFVQRLAGKINRSKSMYNDKLPFTELSELAAGKHNDEYTNVYQKGALIGAILDLKIIESTDGEMNLQKVVEQLSAKYGKNKPFDDDQLFAEITAMTAPEVGEFFETYVAGPNPLPLKEQLDKAGIKLIRNEKKMRPSFEIAALGYDASEDKMKVVRPEKLNTFGKALGLQKDDLLLKLQGVKVVPMKGKALMDSLSTTISEGDTVSWTISRLQDDGSRKTMKLSAPMTMVKADDQYELTILEDATTEQLKLRHRWMNPDQPFAHPKDVSSIDGIIDAMYDMISGPAGPRDWERNASLFKPDAKLAAFGEDEEGKLKYVTMTQEEYRKRNEPFFMKNDFWEEEIGREVFRFGEMATVQTAYKFRLGDEEKANPHRGVNSVQLVYDQGRWWITRITWNSEREDNPIPKTLLDGVEMAP